MALQLPSALEQLVLNLSSSKANVFFCELRQSHGSCLGLEGVACVMAPVAHVYFWSNNHVVWKILKSLHQPMDMIPQVTSDSSGWPWKQFCGYMWMNCHMGPGSFIFPTATERFSLCFFPAVRWDGFPLSLVLLISQLQYCLSPSPRNLMPFWLFLDNPFGFKGHKTPLIPLINVQLWDQIHSWLRSVRVTSGINQVVPLDMYKLASVARTAIKECAFPFQLPLH